jgi:hypothetical protein
MSTPWQQQAGAPIPADDPWIFYFEAADGTDDRGGADDWEPMHAAFQAAGHPYLVTVYPQLPPDPPWRYCDTDETALGSIARCNPSFLD